MGSSSCQICRLDLSAETERALAGKLWGLWDPGDCLDIKAGKGGGRGWIANSNEVLRDNGLLELTAQEWAEHYLEHRPVQPPPQSVQARGAVMYGADALGETVQGLLITVFRLHKMTLGQIQEVFFPERSLLAVERLLSFAVQGHYLYRYFPTDEDRERRGLADVLGKRGTDTVYFLGRAGAAYVKEQLDLGYQVQSTTGEIGKNSLAHDLKVARVGAALRRALAPAGQEHYLGSYREQDLILSFETANWMGPTSQGLTMGFWNPYQGVDAQIMPDSLVSINVHHSALGSGAVPFFIEFDHGSKERGEVVEQIWTYQALAQAGATGARFPQLDGWPVPMLIIFDTPGRRDSIVTAFREKYSDQGPGVPLLFAAEPDWLEDPLAEIIGNFWAGEKRRGLLEVLLDYGQPIIPKLTTGQPLEIDIKAATIRPRHLRANSRSPGNTRPKNKEVSEVIEDFSDELFASPEAITTQALIEKIINARQYLAGLEAQYQEMIDPYQPQTVPVLDRVPSPTKFPEIGPAEPAQIVQPDPPAEPQIVQPDPPRPGPAVLQPAHPPAQPPASAPVRPEPRSDPPAIQPSAPAPADSDLDVEEMLSQEADARRGL